MNPQQLLDFQDENLTKHVKSLCTQLDIVYTDELKETIIHIILKTYHWYELNMIKMKDILQDKVNPKLMDLLKDLTPNQPKQ